MLRHDRVLAILAVHVLNIGKSHSLLGVLDFSGNLDRVASLGENVVDVLESDVAGLGWH